MSVMSASFFDDVGAITSTISADKNVFLANIDGKNWIAGIFSADEYYVANFRPVLRPDMEITINGNILTGLPIPCTVECNGHLYDVNDGSFEYNTPLAGDYPVYLRAFPYRDCECVISVTATNAEEVIRE